jgi:hypothetical protein
MGLLSNPLSTPTGNSYSVHSRMNELGGATRLPFADSRGYRGTISFLYEPNRESTSVAGALSTSRNYFAVSMSAGSLSAHFRVENSIKNHGGSFGASPTQWLEFSSAQALGCDYHARATGARTGIELSHTKSIFPQDPAKSVRKLQWCGREIYACPLYQ